MTTKLVAKVRKTVYPKGHKTSQIMDDFGIGKETVTVDIDINIPKKFDVLYITGESGSGKSLILKELFEESVIDDIHFMETPIIDMNTDSNLVIKTLSLLGLGDASLFTLTPNQLSDSQRFRASIAKLVLDGEKTIVLDEFLSTLDRRTGKSVAYNLQKSLRKLGIKLVVATAHDDLVDYLKPDIVVRGESFPSRFIVEEYRGIDFTDNPFSKKIKIVKGDKERYRLERLGEIHYKGKYSGGKQEYFFAEYEGRVIGVLVTNNLISSNNRRISRVVVHPTYRGVGIAQELIKYCIRNTDAAVDVLAAMAKYTPVFEKSGMIRVDDVVVKPPPGIENKLFSEGFDASRWADIKYCEEFCEKDGVRSILSEYAHLTNKLIQPGGKKLSKEERAEIILKDTTTAARVLWSFRRRVMAKFVSEESD